MCNRVNRENTRSIQPVGGDAGGVRELGWGVGILNEEIFWVAIPINREAIEIKGYEYTGECLKTIDNSDSRGQSHHKENKSDVSKPLTRVLIQKVVSWQFLLNSLVHYWKCSRCSFFPREFLQPQKKRKQPDWNLLKKKTYMLSG